MVYSHYIIQHCLFFSSSVAYLQQHLYTIQIYFDSQPNVYEKFTILNGVAMALSATYNLDVYQPRNPKASAYYKCVENHFEEQERAWDDMYASRYGFLPMS